MSIYSRRLADTIRAEVNGVDLQDEGHQITVCAQSEDGSLYELGHVSAALVLQDPVAARTAIERIKFGREVRNPKPPTSPTST